jgi:hypothetical protein
VETIVKKGQYMKRVKNVAMKYLFLGYFIATLIPCATLFGAAECPPDKPDCNSKLFSCASADGTAECKQAINAVGDLKDIDVRTTPIYKAFGTITKPESIPLALPLLGNQERLTLSLSKPFSPDALDVAMVGVPMEVLIVSSLPDAEALKGSADAKSMIKVYRRMRGTGELNEPLWTEMLTVVSEGNISKRPAVIVINANGNFTLTVGGKKSTIALGKAIVG